ncbi:hypothetical protein J6590_041013 [Homalodisca vitripennis]|nr:hypothetical protein J6590_041013 [Homalodisca vitripennis]
MAFLCLTFELTKTPNGTSIVNRGSSLLLASRFRILTSVHAAPGMSPPSRRLARGQVIGKTEHLRDSLSNWFIFGATATLILQGRVLEDQCHLWNALEKPILPKAVARLGTHLMQF